MKTLRYWLAAACIWLFLLYNVERLGGVLNIAPFVYIYTILCAVTILIFPRLQRIPLHWLLAGAALPYVGLKLYLPQAQVAMPLPIAVTELSGIWLTLALMRRIGLGMEALRQTIEDLTIGHLKDGTHPFETGQGYLYREMRRARQHQHPVTLIALAATPNSRDMSLDLFIRQAQQEIVQEYINAKIAHLVVQELEDYDIITQRGDHFIVLLPETNRERAIEVARRLKTRAQEVLGLDLEMGLAVFPEESITLESLVQQAEARMSTALLESGAMRKAGFRRIKKLNDVFTA